MDPQLLFTPTSKMDAFPCVSQLLVGIQNHPSTSQTPPNSNLKLIPPKSQCWSVHIIVEKMIESNDFFFLHKIIYCIAAFIIWHAHKKFRPSFDEPFEEVI